MQVPPAAASAGLPGSFRRLLVAWAGSLSGDGLRVIALPLLAASIDPSAGAVATVAVAATLPWLLIAIPAGALVDRLDPARVMATAHVARALATLALTALIVTGSVSILELAVFGFVITSAETFADGSAQSLVVRLVPSAHLERANARFVTVETIALDMAGPLAAGVLFLLNPALPFAVSAACFLVAAATVATIRVPPEKPHAPPGGAADQAVNDDTASPSPGLHPMGMDTASMDRAGIDLTPISGPDGTGAVVPGSGDAFPDDGAGARRRRDPESGALFQIREGLRRLVSDPVLRVLVVTVAIMVIANAATDAVLVLYGTQTLKMSEATYPLLLVAYSIGTLTAAALVGRSNSRLRGGQTMMVALFGISATMIALGLFPVVGVALAAYAVMGLAGGTWNVLSATRRQRRTPRTMIARVSSAFRVVAWGVIPVGAALGGVVGEHWGIPAVFLIAGVLILVLGLFVVRSFIAPEPAIEAAEEPSEN